MRWSASGHFFLPHSFTFHPALTPTVKLKPTSSTFNAPFPIFSFPSLFLVLQGSRSNFLSAFSASFNFRSSFLLTPSFLISISNVLSLPSTKILHGEFKLNPKCFVWFSSQIFSHVLNSKQKRGFYEFKCFASITVIRQISRPDRHLHPMSPSGEYLAR